MLPLSLCVRCAPVVPVLRGDGGGQAGTQTVVRGPYTVGNRPCRYKLIVAAPAPPAGRASTAAAAALSSGSTRDTAGHSQAPCDFQALTVVGSLADITNTITRNSDIPVT